MEFNSSVLQKAMNRPIYAAGSGFTRKELHQHTSEAIESEIRRITEIVLKTIPPSAERDALLREMRLE
jgi:hypothetical protein